MAFHKNNKDRWNTGSETLDRLFLIHDWIIGSCLREVVVPVPAKNSRHLQPKIT